MRALLDYVHLQYARYVAIIHTIVAAKRTIVAMQKSLRAYYDHGLITEVGGASVTIAWEPV